MRPYQTRVRKMRQPGRHPGRSTDGIRQAYHDPAIRAAKAAAKAAAAEAARAREPGGGQP
jgi:hypothetical protein